jgi:hypothetical protein
MVLLLRFLLLFLLLHMLLLELIDVSLSLLKQFRRYDVLPFLVSLLLLSMLLHPLEIGDTPQPKGRRRPLRRNFAKCLVGIGGIPVCTVNSHLLLSSLINCRRRHVLAVIVFFISTITNNAIHEVTIQVGGPAPLAHA